MESSLTLQEIEKRLKESDTIEQFKRWQVIYLRISAPQMSIRQVAAICQVPYRTVTQWTWMYKHNGSAAFTLKGRGGRHHSLLTEEQEREILDSFQRKAESGHVVTAASIRDAAEKLLGGKVNKDYAYNMLHRHGWRKIMPHTYHPNGDKEKQNALKKTSRIFWLPSSMIVE